MSNRDPNVSPDGSTVTWAKCDPTASCDIYVAQRATDGTWPVLQLTDSLGEDILPETDGTIVTYASNAGGDYDIWFKDVDGTNDRTLVLTDVPGSIETNPTISGRRDPVRARGARHDRRRPHLCRITTNELFRVTETAVDETLNAVSLTPTDDLRVAWAQPDGLVPGHNDPRRPRAAVGQPAAGPAAAGSGHGRRGRTVGCPGDLRRHRDRRRHRDGDLQPASGATFAIGTTTVTCTAVDDDGATATGSFPVAVRGRAAGPVPRRPHRRRPDQQPRRDDHDRREQAARPVADAGLRAAAADQQGPRAAVRSPRPGRPRGGAHRRRHPHPRRPRLPLTGPRSPEEIAMNRPTRWAAYVAAAVAMTALAPTAPASAGDQDDVRGARQR